MKFLIRGLSKETGDAATFTVDAENENSAIDISSDMGFVIESVTPQEIKEPKSKSAPTKQEKPKNALIHCVDCDGVVSKHADWCVHCGRPMKDRQAGFTILARLMFLFYTIGFLIWAGLFFLGTLAGDASNGMGFLVGLGGVVMFGLISYALSKEFAR